MRMPCAVLLLFAVGANAQMPSDKQFPEAPEPIVRLPYGGYKHDDAGERKKRPETQAAETPATPSWLPRPILFSGPSLPGGGYQMFAGNVGGGLQLNSSKLLGDFEAQYMNARKNDDNTINNRKGHERYLRGRLFYPLHKGLYFGGGAQWSETATTNYTKKAWRPTFGLGGDHFAEDWSCRWQVLYITKGTDKSNAVQRPEFSVLVALTSI